MTANRSVERPEQRPEIAEQIQRKITHLVATLPVGVGLCLVGGFRYRLLDRGVRRSVDIDYHWAGDLEAKQRELIDLFTRRLDDLGKSTLRHAGEAAMKAIEWVRFFTAQRERHGKNVFTVAELAAAIDPDAYVTGAYVRR